MMTRRDLVGIITFAPCLFPLALVRGHALWIDSRFRPRLADLHIFMRLWRHADHPPHDRSRFFWN